MGVCVSVLRPLLFPYSLMGAWVGVGKEGIALSSKCKNAQAHFTDWMPFLPSFNLVEKVTHNPEVLCANT